MCGIYGIVSLRDGVPADADLLGAMGKVTTHRGPDDEGAYAADGVALGMRRLSIIDLAGGHQPIANEDESLWVVCNGEIYNFREVREKLLARGHRFRTGSDAEVIVHLYEDHGLDCVDHMTGMFGFALWDARRRRLVLGRDRLGIKPIYFRRDGQRLFFASEAKAILTVPGATPALDPVALEEYLAYGYTPNHQSIMAGIEKLPPASLLVCERGEIAISRYWSPPAEADGTLSEDEWAKRVVDKLERVVAMEMVSDVPLGAFLSGGVDSSSVVAMMARHSDFPVRTYSIGFDTGPAGSYYNELPYARQVSELFATAHKEILVRPDVVKLLPMLLWHLDEPVADSAFITTYLVAKFARQDVKVILSGVGGDELFGGYRRYLGDYYANRYNRLPAWVRRALIAPIARSLPADRHSPLTNLSRYARAFVESSDRPFEERYRTYVQVFGPDSLDRLLRAARRGEVDSLGAAFAAATGGDGLNRLMRADLLTQLPNDLLVLTDRMTMATSLECRVPLLNHELVELSARLPAEVRIRNRELKHILKVALKGILPESILHRKKRGFGAPIGAWLKNELTPLVKTVLSRETIERRGLFDWRVVAETIALHQAGREDHTDHLLSLINLEVWARLYLDGRSPEDLALELTAEAVA
ncbi:MAG: asparagine synthase (glutamine-hydrolyzing) [Kiloniellaceae bacterium]